MRKGLTGLARHVIGSAWQNTVYGGEKMDRETKRKVVSSMFIVATIVVLCLGVLLAMSNYETYMASKVFVLRDWRLRMCSTATCKYGDEWLETMFTVTTIGISVAVFLLALVVAIILYIVGHDYYKCGRFDCPEENRTG